MDIQQLREALNLSPENAVLRKMLADMLMQQAEYAEAEREYRTLLSQGQDQPALQAGLALAFSRQGKDSEALALLESLIPTGQASGEAWQLYVQLLVRESRVPEAILQYQKMTDFFPELVDNDFEQRYNITSTDPEDVVVAGRARAMDNELPVSAETMLERPGVKFEDVGGMSDLKEEIHMKVVMPVANPDLFKAYGKKVGGGILMYGPPGCGKTFLARATAGEVNAGFMAIGIHDVLDMWIGNSERKLHELFEQARMHKPCVLFFDEVDALGASRSDMKNSGGRHLINQFLSELDGVKSDNEGVMILAATNAPWHLDSAFRRPGRFDTIIFVPPPDREARAEILKLKLKDKPVGSMDYAAIAKKTEGFSGADLEGLVNKAVEAKLIEAMKAGKAIELTTKDIMGVMKKIKPSTKDWFASARNYALYSNQSGLYDDILEYLKLI
ncbi:MAG: transitional endoplasmic reticulum ATPase [Kiritimatiellia bacterium]|jgi:transitional endoplasmic reticulum ATPase